MSALGQKRTFAVQNSMSALPPIADMCGAKRDARFGPKADIARYSITSSARASSCGGRVRPSAFAVLRLGGDPCHCRNTFDPVRPFIDRPRCQNCGSRMWVDHIRRRFECPRCQHVESVVVKYK